MKINRLKLILLVFILSIIKVQAQNKSLIVYFSHSNNTKVIAEYIHEFTDADIFRIEPVNKYPSEYQAVVDQAKKEINEDFRPKLKGMVNNFDQYDTIYVGSPNWWSTIAPPVATFLSSYDFEGKTIIQFMTHEGSRFGRSTADIRKICPEANMLKGFECRGSQVGKAKDEVKTWLQEIK